MLHAVRAPQTHWGTLTLVYLGEGQEVTSYKHYIITTIVGAVYKVRASENVNVSVICWYRWCASLYFSIRTRCFYVGVLGSIS